MLIQIALPDDIACSLETKWGNLERKLLEMLAIAAYQEGSISVGKVRELLAFLVIFVLDCPILSLRNKRHHLVEQFEFA